MGNGRYDRSCLSDELFFDPLGFPISRPALPHPLRDKRSFDGVAADRAPVTVGGVWPLPRRRRMGEIEGNFVSLEFRFGDGQFGDARFAVDDGAAVVAESARQRATVELEFQGLRGGARLGVGGGNSYFPGAGGIDGRLPCPDRCAGAGQEQQCGC